MNVLKKGLSMNEQFKIGKLAELLKVEKFVIRFWEKEFAIRPQRTMGGQRFYEKEDFEQFKLIKELLYKKGFTIAGAKKVLNQRIKNTAIINESQTDKSSTSFPISEKLSAQIYTLQKQLIKLRDLL